MTLEAFLRLMLVKFGSRCTNEWWTWKYSTFKDKSAVAIKSEIPFLAVESYAISLTQRGGHYDRRL